MMNNIYEKLLVQYSIQNIIVRYNKMMLDYAKYT